MGVTTALRRALKGDFFPYVETRGFVADTRFQPRSTIYRRRGLNVMQMFEIQWEKYGKPRFAVRFGTCSLEGLHIRGERYSPEVVLPTWCADAGSLQPGRGAGAGSWFRQDATVVQRLLLQPALRQPADVTQELLALFPELERYWASGEIGPHLRLWHPGRE